jgi:adenine-specific DNA methylase
MKTLIIYDSCGQQDLKGAIIEGDKSKYNGIVFNAYIENKEKRKKEEELENEFCNEFGDDFSIFNENIAPLIESKNFDKVAVVAFIP